MRLNGKRDGSIRKYLAVFRAALNRCRKEGILVGEIPGFDLPPAGPPRKQILTEAQFKRFMQADAEPHVDLFCMLMANTLKRPGAILQLQWSWGVDFQSGIIDFQPPDLRETKKRRTPSPMNATLEEALADAKDYATTDFVIEYSGKPLLRIKRGFKTKAVNAGLSWVTPYVLRHTGASLLSMKGVRLADIAEMMGSDEATVSKHYRKFQPDYLRTASKALEALYLPSIARGQGESAQLCAQT
jgi:integrase